MRVVFTSHGWDDYTHWRTADRTMTNRINRLIDATHRDPLTSIGKP